MQTHDTLKLLEKQYTSLQTGGVLRDSSPNHDIPTIYQQYQSKLQMMIRFDARKGRGVADAFHYELHGYYGRLSIDLKLYF